MVKISGAKISKPRNTRAPAPPAHARARARAAKIFKVLCARVPAPARVPALINTRRRLGANMSPFRFSIEFYHENAFFM